MHRHSPGGGSLDFISLYPYASYRNRPLVLRGALFYQKAGIDVDEEGILEDLDGADFDFWDGDFVRGVGGAGLEEFTDLVAEGVADGVADAGLEGFEDFAGIEGVAGEDLDLGFVEE